jgi:DNA-directed RNA polymerase II subunit RPB2
MNSEVIWNIIDTYFNDNPYALVSHHLDSYNQFFKTGLNQIFREKNPIRILKQQDETTKNFNLECLLYLGGKDGSKIYYGKPMIYDDNYTHFMYPNEARLRNMTYAFTVHYDVDVEFKIVDEEEIHHKITLEKIFLGRFPIMLQSDMCILQNLEPKVRFELGECINDPGGYFIIDGKEKVIVCQEKFGDNMLYIRDNYSDTYHYSVEVKSASEDASKPKRTTAVRLAAPLPTQSNGQIVVTIPNVRKPIPLFIVMRALGILSDKAIMETCLLDMEKHSTYVDLFIPSIHDASVIFTQETALKYIATFTKGKTIPHVLEILSDYFLPHVGEMNFEDKAYYIGNMVFTLLRTSLKEQSPTDRDNFKYKRVEVVGSLLYDLFKEYFTIMQHKVYQKIDKEYYYHEGQYQGASFINLIENNYKEFFKERDVDSGFRKAFKGNWGAEAHTKKMGVVQGLNRLSFNSALAQRRKINLPLDDSAKVIGPRLLHSSQWGIIDPLDTPDGGNVGLHKHMSIAAKITTHYTPHPLVDLLRSEGYLRYLSECKPEFMAANTKVFVNGAWVGISTNPLELSDRFKLLRRIAAIPIYTSYAWDKQTNEIEIFTDAGRLCRPIFYLNNNRSLSLSALLEREGAYSWEQLVTGFNKKEIEGFHSAENKVYTPDELYGDVSLKKLDSNKAIIEYIDSSEENVAYISSTLKKSYERTDYTHADIHPSLMLGVMGNQIIFPENNQLPRNLFSCGQSKQAASWYHTNYQNRIDKMGVVLNYGQKPLVKSRYLQYINKETQPYGENPIVAIMCYGGYNVEDSILFNEASVKRGMFRTTYLNSYEAHEEAANVGGGVVDSVFTDIQNENVVGTKPGFDYAHLDQYGLIKENTELNDKIAVIGKASIDLDDPSVKTDASVYPKKGQLGFVDKAFMTEGEEGRRIAKVRIREERIPAIGDKFCSRCGQKGTVGLVIPEENMPFTADGIRPDIIVNPHAFPSRMTIGQLVEVLIGKTALNYGAFGDCTAFLNEGPKDELFGKLLSDMGYNKTGNEILYNGMTGEQLESSIYIGPTYYMRLKHMVKDKINYRARGPRTLLTRQTVQGRANDGGLRVGEMERDGIIAHGAAHFLEESMMVRGDEYYMAICNHTGTVAIYNESKNLFLSPMADGPIKFNGEIDEKLSIINISRYGRSFSVVRVPYTFKLLMQELTTMNVQMRVITDKNVDQLTSMSYSNNISLLLKDDNVTPKNVQNENEKERTKKSFVEVGKEREIPDLQPEQPRGYGVFQPSQPIWSGDIVYYIGEFVNFSRDTRKNPIREWKITAMDKDSGEYTLTTTDLTNLPDFVLLSDDGTSASVLANKLEISIIPPTTGYGYGQQSPPTTGYGYGQQSPEYNPGAGYGQQSPEYNPGAGYGQQSPEYNPGAGYGQQSPEYNPGAGYGEYNPGAGYGQQTQPAPDSFDYAPHTPPAAQTSPEHAVPKYGAVPPPGATIQGDTVLGAQTPPAPDSFDYAPRTPPEHAVSNYGAVPPPGATIQGDTVLGAQTPPAAETPKAWFELGPGESPDYGPGPEGETPAEFSRRTGIYPGSGSQSPLEKYLPQKVGESPTPPKEINILTNLTELKPKLDPVSDPKDNDNDNKDKKKIVIKL